MLTLLLKWPEIVQENIKVSILSTSEYHGIRKSTTYLIAVCNSQGNGTMVKRIERGRLPRGFSKPEGENFKKKNCSILFMNMTLLLCSLVILWHQ